MIIGSSISEAIDWTQDLLRTTRPLAEQTLFALLMEAKVEETEQGFALHEEDTEEVHKQHNTVKGKFTQNWRRYRFHAKRKMPKRYNKKRRSYAMQYADTVEDMWDDTEEH